MNTLTQNGISFTAAPWPPAPERPTLIFIHGSAMSKSFWQPQMEGLSAEFNTIALDLPGHGDSPGAGHDSMAAYGQAVIDFIHALAPPRPVPCGLSLGGAVVQYLLIHHPDRFAAGILINTGARLRVLPLIFEAIRNNFDDFVNLSHLGGVAAVNQSPAMAEKIRAAMRCTPDTAIRDFTACDTFDVMARLPEIKVPVLIISGNDDTTTPPKYAAYLAQHIAGAELVTIPDAAHLAPLEQPGAVNRAISNFLKRMQGA
ncbi:MAG: alpha/beta fold hydrolase [Thermodesulfobacteriota bacterium]